MSLSFVQSIFLSGDRQPLLILGIIMAAAIMLLAGRDTIREWRRPKEEKVKEEEEKSRQSDYKEFLAYAILAQITGDYLDGKLSFDDMFELIPNAEMLSISGGREPGGVTLALQELRAASVNIDDDDEETSQTRLRSAVRVLNLKATEEAARLAPTSEPE